MRGAPFGFALAALLFAQSARAESPAIDAPPAPPPAPAAPKEAEAGAAEAGAAEATGGEEIIVFGQLQVAKARKKLDRDIRELGYRNGEKKGDHTVYRPQSAWRPTVVVYDDGFVVLRRTRPRFEPWVKGKTKLVWLSCIPPFTLMCIKLSGWLVSPARLEPQKARVANGIDPELRGWREAIIARNMEQRIGIDLPEALDQLWLEGKPMRPDRPPLPTPEERRAAVLAFWAERSCTPEGQAVRDLVEIFLAMEVQRSPFPAPSAELRAAEATQACGDRLEGPGLDAP